VKHVRVLFLFARIQQQSHDRAAQLEVGHYAVVVAAIRPLFDFLSSTIRPLHFRPLYIFILHRNGQAMIGVSIDIFFSFLSVFICVIFLHLSFLSVLFVYRVYDFHNNNENKAKDCN